jgi:uncharacterized RDD family membrane protein YckC
MTGPGQTPPGWYYAQGDPPGTERYWDGVIWQGDPRGSQPISADLPSGINLASGGSRIGARVIDGFIMVFIQLVFVVPLAGAGNSSTYGSSSGIGTIAFSLAIAIIYEPVLTALTGGTPGKLILGLRVVEAETLTTPPSMPVSIKRWVIGLVGFLHPLLGIIAILILSIMSLVWVFTDTMRRSIYDRIGGTYVIKK